PERRISMLARTFRGARRRGVVIILVALSLVALISIVALALDGGTLLAERRQAQATADAAALAAASDLFYNYWTYSGADVGGTAKAAALAEAASNGYTNDGTTSVVTVNIPPLNGPYAGMRGYSEVIVEYRISRSFSNLFTQGPISVRARAVSFASFV